MSQIKVNIIRSPESTLFTKGLSVSSNKIITADVVNVSGMMTCGSFVGDGSDITNIPTVSVGKFISISLLH